MKKKFDAGNTDARAALGLQRSKRVVVGPTLDQASIRNGRGEEEADDDGVAALGSTRTLIARDATQ